MKELVKDAEEDHERLSKVLKSVMYEIPNIPHESVVGGPIPYHTMIPERAFTSYY